MLSEAAIKTPIDGLIASSSWINYLLLMGAGLCLTISILRILGKHRFSFGQLELPFNALVYLIPALTIAHAFLTWIFVQQIEKLLNIPGCPVKRAWDSLTSSSFVFLNMQPRTLGEESPILGTVHIAQYNDTAFWFTLALYVLLILSIPMSRIPNADRYARGPVLLRRYSTIVTYIEGVAFGCVFAGINWLIGSQWAIAASKLGG